MAQNPWDIRSDDSRSEDTVTTFIIFCEDEVSEPAYLRTFAVHGSVKVNAIENQKQHWHNLQNALADCERNGLIESIGGSHRIKENATINIWSAYDRDMESEVVDDTVMKNDIHFTNAIAQSNNIGIKVAWSNDVFELWILLHFEMIPTGTRLHRNYIYERLTRILKELPNSSEGMDVITSKANFDYKSYFKKRGNFISHILPLLTAERRETAISNALKLEACFNDNLLFHNRNPYTTIHHLVHDLLLAQ
jgi:hypothetical protein